MMQLSGKMEKGLSPKDKAKKLTEKRTCRHTCQAFRHLSRAFRFQIDRFHDWISHFLSCSLSRPLFYSVSSSSSSSSIYFFFLNFCLLILIPVLQLICLMKKKKVPSLVHIEKKLEEKLVKMKNHLEMIGFQFLIRWFGNEIFSLLLKKCKISANDLIDRFPSAISFNASRVTGTGAKKKLQLNVLNAINKRLRQQLRSAHLKRSSANWELGMKFSDLQRQPCGNWSSSSRLIVISLCVFESLSSVGGATICINFKARHER